MLENSTPQVIYHNRSILDLSLTNTDADKDPHHFINTPQTTFDSKSISKED